MWWLILLVNLTKPQCPDIWWNIIPSMSMRMFWKKLTFETDWVKQTDLRVGGPHPSIEGRNETKRLTGPSTSKRELHLPDCLELGLRFVSCFWIPTETLALLGFYTCWPSTGIYTISSCISSLTTTDLTTGQPPQHVSIYMYIYIHVVESVSLESSD